MKTTKDMKLLFIILSLLFSSNCKEDDAIKYQEEDFWGVWKAYELIIDDNVYTQFTIFNTFYNGVVFKESGYCLVLADSFEEPIECSQNWKEENQSISLFNGDGEVFVIAKVEKLADGELWLRHSENDMDKLIKFRKQ